MKDLVIGFLIAMFISAYLASGGPTPYTNGWNLAPPGVSGPDPVTDVNAGTFQGEVLDSHNPVLVEFFVDGDMHCVNMKPVVAEMATESLGFLHVVRIDGNANVALTSRYDVKTYPAFVIFKDGRAVNATSGEISKKDLENWVKRELDIPVN
jgi:thioredoxin 1